MIFEVFGILASFLALLFILIYCVLVWRHGPTLEPPSSDSRIPCLVVLGSGGHTAEMFYDLRSLGDLLQKLDITYLVADTDSGSLPKAEAFQAEFCGGGPPCVLRVPRAREVGQSYVTSVFTTLYATLVTLWHVLSVQPRLILCNGPGTCVPPACIALLMRRAGIGRCHVVYSESFACVEHLSMSGRILYKLADVVTVQWPHLLPIAPQAVYAGRLASDEDAKACLSTGSLPPPAELPLRDAAGNDAKATAGLPTAIVTVGSTRFDALIEAVDHKEFVAFLRRLGIRRLKVQHGSGPAPSSLSALASGDFQVEVMKYTRDLAEELRSASLVVSHAGAGTILDCLLAGVRMIVVPNEQLMANHQVQLGAALEEQRLLFCLRASELVDGLARLDFGSLRRMPGASSPVFGQCVRRELGLVG